MDDTYVALTRMLTPALPWGLHIFLTVLLAYGVVASRLGPCEKLLPYGKVATSSRATSSYVISHIPHPLI